MRYVLAIDQGTTGSTVLVIDEALQVRGRGYSEFRQLYPQPGWVEHDPEDIWQSVLVALGRALGASQIDPGAIAALGITNQRETSVLWERASGRPVHNAIVWQDRRTTAMCAELKNAGHEAMVRQRTGLTLDPYFSATKIAWMLDHAGLRGRAEAGDLAFGTIDSFLVSRLSKGALHVTDVTNASRTLLFDLHAQAFSDELLALFGVPRKLLPTVLPSSHVFGATVGLPGLPDGIPIAGIAGDQQAALFGQACFVPGAAKCTYGTGAFILLNTGHTAVASKAGLLTTVAWQLAGESVTYALEGSAFIAGAAVQWLRDGLGFFSSAAEVEALAAAVPDSGGVVVVPAFAGLGAPHWRPEARGLISGLTRGTTRAHIARATLEGMALQNVDILRAMSTDAGLELSLLRVDGGAAANDLLMQFQADVLGVTISRPAMLETTALGAAVLAGLGVGLWKSKDEVAHAWREARRFSPSMPAPEVASHLRRWHDAIAKA
ncbi:MAG: glycerol kinase GlpK [Myxococcales bacterium]|nr:glycerol kinase GlpK [Myxococcales bacterium]